MSEREHTPGLNPTISRATRHYKQPPIHLQATPCPENMGELNGAEGAEETVEVIFTTPF